MRVRVDRERCFGYGRCVDLVPEVFHLDDDDKSVADRDAAVALFHSGIRNSAEAGSSN